MNNRRMVVEAPRGDAGRGVASSEIRTFRLADYALIDVGGAPPRHQEVLRALLREWASSPAGVLISVNTDELPDDGTVRAITAAAAALVQTWPGTPVGLLSHSRELRQLVAQDPHGHHLAIGATLADIWDGLWSRGGKANITIELPPTGQAPRTARDVVLRACLDWNLNALAVPAALLTGDLVARSLVQGAQDIHFTVSGHQSRLRVLVRDDVDSSAVCEPSSIDDVFDTQFTAPEVSDLAASLGEFAFGGHHVRWGVLRDAQPASRGA